MFGLSENQCQNKNQDPRELGLKFEKTNVEIRISILKRLCLCVHQFLGKTNSPKLTFSAQICLKMDLGLEIQKTNVGIRIIAAIILFPH